MAKRPRSRLAVGWLTLFVVGTDLFIVSPLLPSIAHEYRQSAAAVGLSVTAFSVTYMLGAPLFGALADRLGRRLMLTGCLLAFAAANLFSSNASNFTWFVLSRAVAGASAAGVSPLVYADVGEAAPVPHRTTWMAIAVSGVLLALSVGAPLGLLIGAASGWRTPFFVLAALSVILAVANRLVWPADPTRVGTAAVRPARLPAVTLMQRLAPTAMWATALYSVYTYLGISLTAAGMSAPQIARVISCYGLGALIGTLLGGQTADRIGVKCTILASLAGFIPCLLALGLALGSAWSASLVLGSASVFAQLFFPAQQSSLAQDFPERRATVLALNNSALFLGISLGSLIGGEVVVRAGFAANTAISAVITSGALAIAAVVIPGPTHRLQKCRVATTEISCP
jgi:predicted MFS family arabinose efflux permease